MCLVKQKGCASRAEGGCGRYTSPEAAGKFLEGLTEFLIDWGETDLRNKILVFSKLHYIMRSLPSKL